MAAQAHTGNGSDLAFAPDGRTLVSVGGDGGAVWSLRSGNKILSFSSAGKLADVSFSADGNRIATAGEDRRARIWDAGTGRELLNLELPDAVTSVAFSPDGTELATGDANGIVRRHRPSHRRPRPPRSRASERRADHRRSAVSQPLRPPSLRGRSGRRSALRISCDKGSRARGSGTGSATTRFHSRPGRSGSINGTRTAPPGRRGGPTWSPAARSASRNSARRRRAGGTESPRGGSRRARWCGSRACEPRSCRPAIRRSSVHRSESSSRRIRGRSSVARWAVDGGTELPFGSPEVGYRSGVRTGR